METDKTAHPTLGVEFSLLYEGFDEPVAKLGYTVRTETRDVWRDINLTGMRTVLRPNSFRRWTSASVNQVRQCSSKISSAVSGFALVRSLSICSEGRSVNVRDG